MSILDEIAAKNKQVVRESKRSKPLRVLEGLPLFSLPRQPPVTALKREGISLIAEFKRRSPSGTSEVNHSVADVASSYESNGASAMSVLTEPSYFGGSLGDLETARKSCALPLLRKDFIIDEYQIVEARAHGADMVLLIAAILGKNQMEMLVQTCFELEIEPLVELYETSEIDILPLDAVRLIGANNRDLRTFEVDTRRASDILAHIPLDKVRIAESGITNSRELRYAEEAKLDAALVGSHLMSAENPGAALAELLSEVST